MLLAPVTAAVTAHATAATPPSWANRSVATVNYKLSDWKIRATAEVIGDAAGYASIDDAITAAAQLTTGESNGAAGVFARDGRFHVRGLTGEWYLSLNPKARSAAEKFTFMEHVALSQFPELVKDFRTTTDGTGTSFPVDAELAAIVDAATTLRIR